MIDFVADAVLPVVVLIYYRLRQSGRQRWLLLASYFFYGYWAFSRPGTWSTRLANLAITVGLLLLIRSFLPAGITLPISGLSILAALVASASVGVVFGYLPARRAATLQPVDALRYE